MINRPLIYAALFLSSSLVIVLHFYPIFDLKFSALFYDSQQKIIYKSHSTVLFGYQGFVHKTHPLVQFFYYIIPPLVKISLSLCCFYLVYLLIRYRNFKSAILSGAAYLIITAVIGPGVIINSILKEEVGRARPSQVSYFHGLKIFAPILINSDQCQSNCSFPSGHAAAAYYFTALAYAFTISKQQQASTSTTKLPLKKVFRKDSNIKIQFSFIYILFFIFGMAVGLSRIVMGAHFLSDVAAACFIILAVNHLLYLAYAQIISKSFGYKVNRLWVSNKTP